MIKYLYLYLWIFQANIHRLLAKFLWRPLFWMGYKTMNMTEKEFYRRLRIYDEAFLQYPGGTADWMAFGTLGGIIYTIILIPLTIKPIHISKYIHVMIVISIFIFLSYSIYFKNDKWLKRRINKMKKRYYTHYNFFK